MSAAVGDGDSANSTGWHLRAAPALCDATLLAIRTAPLDIKLDKIGVRVEGSSDGRGMFLDDGVSAGSSEMRLNFCIEGAPVSACVEGFDVYYHAFKIKALAALP